ncbi:NACHT domain-containing NTPase [Sorangium cellulosum]|uniref:NACHT domain-containing protein n=1 Tax=Sorangium cellulosum TaxID=56 RepID=UPI003D9A9782
MLERYIAHFAREYLGDPSAVLYGRQGQGQHGLDVLARDRRPAGTGRLWAFQAKNYRAKRLNPSDLENMAEQLRCFQHWKEIDTFVVVTTAAVSAGVQSKALALGRQLRIDFQVWGWEHFSDLLIRHCGAGPWLSQRDRARLRQEYCAQVRRELQQAGPLYPLSFHLPGTDDIHIEEVLLPQILRLASRQGELSHRQPDRRPQVGSRPPRHEGQLIDWLDIETHGKPLILVLAPMGAGKTVAVLTTASQLAQRAAGDDRAPLPLHVRATQLVGTRLDLLIPRLPFDGIPRLWTDPMSRWVLLVDALDEVEERAQQGVLQELIAVYGRQAIMAVALTCRTSHLHPRLLPEATLVEIATWREQEWQDFSSRWAHSMAARGRASSPRSAITSDASTRASPLCSTLLALQQPEHTDGGAGRARLFRWFVDALFRRWAEDRDGSAWKRLREAFEQVALDALARGGRALSRSALESALARVLGEAEVDSAIETAELKLGLLRRIDGSAWELPQRAVAEYLAAGALLRRSDEQIIGTAGKPWAGEIARLALDRCWDADSTRALTLLSGLHDVLSTDTADAPLRRILVAAQAARDREQASAPVAETLATALFESVTDETSAWRRRRVGAEVRRFALDGGPVWEALWPKLKPVLLAVGDRASWIAERDHSDPEAWIQRLLEEDPAVRGVAISRLAERRAAPEIHDILLWELLDEGYAFEFSAWRRPAFVAAAVLRHAPRDEGDRAFLQMLLTQGSWISSEAAALALLPGETDTDALLTKLKELVSRGDKPPAAYHAIEAHRRVPEGRSWLERNWPEALAPDFAPPQQGPEPPAGDSPIAPPSRLVRRDLLQITVEAFHRSEVREALALMPPGQSELTNAICLAAEHAPEAALDLLERAGDIFIPADAQDALGRAALRHPAIGRALVTRWRRGTDAQIPSSFPGVALEPLAARGEPDAVAVYAAWLPHNPFMMPLVPWCPPSQGALRHPPIRAAARAAARDAWDHANRGRPDANGEIRRLYPTTLSLVLRGLWPAWVEDREISDALIAWAQGTELERFNVSLAAWMEGDFPEEVAQALQRRICDVDGWPSNSPFFPLDLARWLSAAARARILRQVEPVLRMLVGSSAPLPVIHQATSYLMLLHPDEAPKLAEQAASLRPFLNEDDRELADNDEERLLASAPEAWGRACLETLRVHDRAVALPFLRMARRLWSHLSDSSLRDDFVQVTRKLARYHLPWVSTDVRWPCVRLSDAAEELLFLMGESAPSPE